MKAVTKYVTDDGRSFDRMEDALTHEKRMRKDKMYRVDVCESHCYSVWIKAKSSLAATDKFHENPDAWEGEKEDYEICIDSVEVGEVREE